MDRTIRVTSDKQNTIITNLDRKGRELERKAKAELSISQSLYSSIFFAINPDGNKTALGQFYPNGKYIVLNESMLDNNLAFDTILNVFLHEMAHAMDWAINDELSGHSARFRLYCNYLGIDSGFDKAAVKKNILDKQRKTEKIDKLLALSSSPFENEAIAALAKAQRLMIENNISEKNENTEEKLYISDLYEASRIPYYITKITNLTSKACGTYIVLCRIERNHTIIRCYGSLKEVEFSLYFFDYMVSSLENEINKQRKMGISITKDSFVMGAIPELERKLSIYDSTTSTALAIIKKENEEKTRRLVFKTGLRTIKAKSRSVSYPSLEQGRKFGKNMNLPSSIGQKKIT